MPGPLDLPPISTGILASVEQASVSYGVTRDQMTEAASRAAAALSRKLLDNQVEGASVVALAGNGVKGCVALHALRILHGFGSKCSAVLLGGEPDMRPETARAAAVCEALRLPLLQPRSPAVRTAVADAALVIDGLVGVGLDGAPREPLAGLIQLSNEVRADALSLECPSGLEPDTGEPLQPTLKARPTLATAPARQPPRCSRAPLRSAAGSPPRARSAASWEAPPDPRARASPPTRPRGNAAAAGGRGSAGSRSRPRSPRGSRR